MTGLVSPGVHGHETPTAVIRTENNVGYCDNGRRSSKTADLCLRSCDRICGRRVDAFGKRLVHEVTAPAFPLDIGSILGGSLA